MIASATIGLLRDDRLEVPGREGQADRRLVGDDLGDPRLAVEHRQLPEEVAGAEVGDRLAVADHADAAARDHEEPRPDVALPGDHVARRELDFDAPSAIRASPSASTPASSGRRGQQLGRRSRVSVIGPPAGSNSGPASVLMLRCATASVKVARSAPTVAGSSPATSRVAPCARWSTATS